MTDLTADQISPDKPKSKRGLLIGLVLLIAASGGSYVAASKVFAPSGSESDAGQSDAGHDAKDSSHDQGDHPQGSDVAFVALDPMLVSLAGTDRHLRFVAQVEVPSAAQEPVAALMPRLVDTLQDYLRAVDADQMSEADALLRLRSQMLRRLQMVAGPDQVSDLLIMEFVLN